MVQNNNFYACLWNIIEGIRNNRYFLLLLLLEKLLLLLLPNLDHIKHQHQETANHSEHSFVNCKLLQAATRYKHSTLIQQN